MRIFLLILLTSAWCWAEPFLGNTLAKLQQSDFYKKHRLKQAGPVKDGWMTFTTNKKGLRMRAKLDHDTYIEQAELTSSDDALVKEFVQAAGPARVTRSAKSVVVKKK